MTEKIKRAALCALTMLTLLLTACESAPFRLHIIANSDSDADQTVKMQVRDAVLDATKDGILGCGDAGEARAYIEEHLEIIEKTANETLAENGFDYTAAAQVGTFHFPERTYRDVTYPEGDYEALRITLGEGEGHNWWCVMFPPLCLTEIGEPGGEEVQYTSFFAELLGLLH